MRLVAEEYEKGELDARIPAEKFLGVFKTMAEGVNGMVAGQIAVNQKVMACVAEFGRGNFDTQLDSRRGRRRKARDAGGRLQTRG